MDPELLKRILFAVGSSNPVAGLGSSQVKIEGRSEDDIADHIELLFEEEYLKGLDVTVPGGRPTYLSLTLTQKGHALLGLLKCKWTLN